MFRNGKKIVPICSGNGTSEGQFKKGTKDHRFPFLTICPSISCLLEFKHGAVARTVTYQTWDALDTPI